MSSAGKVFTSAAKVSEAELGEGGIKGTETQQGLGLTPAQHPHHDDYLQP